jgi:hypothetical protein
VTTFRLLSTFPGVAGDNHIIAILRFHGIPFHIRHNAKALIEKDPRADEGRTSFSLRRRCELSPLMNPVIMKKKPNPKMLSDYMVLPTITVAL